MRDLVNVTGMVIMSMPVGDYDKRLVLLTKERGKITVFARGARRQNSMLMAGSRPFSFGQFMLYEGRDAYNLQSMEITNYFDKLCNDMEGTCYGFYFMEYADYFGRENMESGQLLKLLYLSLKALSNDKIPNPLVQAVFEFRNMVINGEYLVEPPFDICESTHYALEFIIGSPVEKLYTFAVTEQVLCELRRCVKISKNRYIDKTFRSLDMLQVLTKDTAHEEV